MAKIKVTIKCPGCEHENQQICRKPGFFEASVVDFKCAVCESDVRARVIKARKAPGSGMVNLQVKMVRMSEKFRASLAEQQKEQEAELGTEKTV